MRLPVVFAALVWAGACGGALPSGEASGGRGGAGGSGGAASGAMGGASAGGAGGVSVTTLLDAGVITGPGPTCDSPAAACACDSQASECQPVLKTVCVGQHCPPSLDDAMLVANWPLDSASTPLPRVEGHYSQCESGSRGFTISHDAGANRGFAYNANGRLALSYTFAGDGSCAQLVCGAFATGPSSSCSGCRMFSDPRPAGSFVPPGAGIVHGPEPNCEIDENGRWSIPGLAPAH